jgi:hypothetical protein
MPMFMVRWPDGSFALAEAWDEDDAYVQFDEIADCPSEIHRLNSCLLDFGLTDRGTFRLHEIGVDTGEQILELGYPELRKEYGGLVSTDTLVDGPEDVKPKRSMRAAVRAERKRLKGNFGPPAATAVGKEIQKKMGCSGPYADILAARAVAEPAEAGKAAAQPTRKTAKKKAVALKAPGGARETVH